MDGIKKYATQAQVAALMDFMHDHSELAKGSTNSGVEKEELETQWEDLSNTLNSMGGAIKSPDRWKRTWHDLKYTSKKRALQKQQQSTYDSGLGLSSDSQNDCENSRTPKKRCVSFDEEIIRIERDKLDLDREYKVQKIEVLSRIASALEELAKKKS